jgi:hypothetical protein
MATSRILCAGRKSREFGLHSAHGSARAGRQHRRDRDPAPRPTATPQRAQRSAIPMRQAPAAATSCRARSPIAEGRPRRHPHTRRSPPTAPQPSSSRSSPARSTASTPSPSSVQPTACPSSAPSASTTSRPSPGRCSPSPSRARPDRIDELCRALARSTAALEIARAPPTRKGRGDIATSITRGTAWIQRKPTPVVPSGEPFDCRTFSTSRGLRSESLKIVVSPVRVRVSPFAKCLHVGGFCRVGHASLVSATRQTCGPRPFRWRTAKR